MAASRFYRGGTFGPGGIRVPAGGLWYDTTRGYVSGRVRRRGQFGPGGTRVRTTAIEAPARTKQVFATYEGFYRDRRGRNRYYSITVVRPGTREQWSDEVLVATAKQALRRLVGVDELYWGGAPARLSVEERALRPTELQQEYEREEYEEDERVEREDLSP
jgi:hypothetical protein